MVRLIIKTVFLLSVIIFIIYKVDHYFVPDNHNYERFNFFYEQEKNSLDILIIGNSHSQLAFNTRIIDAKCNVKSYNLSIAGANLFAVYANLLEALKYQTPKLVIIENYSYLLPGETNDNFKLTKSRKVNFSKSIYSKRLGAVKIDEVNSFFPDNKIMSYFNIFRNHENWTDYDQSANILFNYTSDNYSKNYESVTKRFDFLDKEKAKRFDEIDFNENMILSNDEKLYLKKINELSIKNNFKLLYVTTPVYGKYYKAVSNQFDSVNKEFKTLIKNLGNISFLDLNKNLNLDRTYIQNEPVVNYNQHLNYKGQIIVSNELANYLNENYEISSTNKNETYFAEDLMYNPEVLNDNGDLKGGLTLINNQNAKNNKKIRVKSGSDLVIKGWNFDTKNNYHQDDLKFIILKKNDNFIYISDIQQIKSYEAKSNEKKYGLAAKNSNFTFSMNTNLLEKGVYRIFIALQTQDGKARLKNSGNIIEIE